MHRRPLALVALLLAALSLAPLARATTAGDILEDILVIAKQPVCFDIDTLTVGRGAACPHDTPFWLEPVEDGLSNADAVACLYAPHHSDIDAQNVDDLFTQVRESPLAPASPACPLGAREAWDDPCTRNPTSTPCGWEPPGQDALALLRDTLRCVRPSLPYAGPPVECAPPLP